jgi:hypothetical protein
VTTVTRKDNLARALKHYRASNAEDLLGDLSDERYLLVEQDRRDGEVLGTIYSDARETRDRTLDDATWEPLAIVELDALTVHHAHVVVMLGSVIGPLDAQPAPVAIGDTVRDTVLDRELTVESFGVKDGAPTVSGNSYWAMLDDVTIVLTAADREEAEEAAKERATCSVCLARTYRGEECVCEDGGDAEDYDEALAAELLARRRP